MSISFYIKNPKKLFRPKPVFTVGDCLTLSTQDITQFNTNPYDEDFDQQAFYGQSLSELVCLLCGVEEQSGRGFELSFDEETQSYAVRVMTPSTLEDWQIALRYIKDLATVLDQPIESEHGDQFTAKTIEQFDYKNDILYGLQAFAAQIKENDIENLTLYGIVRPVAVNAGITEQILSHADPIAEFSRFYRNIQWLDAYSARQMFYRKDDENDNEIIGVYVLGHDVRTILPFTPSVDFEHSQELSNADITRWVLFLVADEDEHYELPYAEAIARLPKDKYRFIDAGYIVVDAFGTDELRALAGENKP